MTHDIPEEVKNSNLEYCITEYVRLESHRAILRDRWFLGLTLEQLAEKYYLSDTRLKDIVYGIGDKVLLKAAKM
jgi:DNA-directed RNA polymerase sigma subunit (sigma70/sigma32)